MSGYFSSESEGHFESARRRIAEYRVKREKATFGGRSPLDLARELWYVIEKGRPSDAFKPGRDY